MTVFQTLKRAPAYRVVEESIRGRILDGGLAPGSLLPAENDLAAQLGVTRPTVREALRALESSGLIGRGPRRRMVVTAPSARVVCDAMHDAIVLHGITHREVWEVAMALEPTGAELAARRITPALVELLEANLERTEECLDDPVRLAAADIEFHELVVRASGNRALVLARDQIGEWVSAERLFPAYRRVLRKTVRRPPLLAAHRGILDALRARDPVAARERMAKHVADLSKGAAAAGIDLDSPMGQRLPTEPRDE